MRTLKEMNIEIGDMAYCEHCGQLEKYTAIWLEDGEDPAWCLTCADTIPEFEITEMERAAIQTAERGHKISYFKQRIKELQS